jgi:hypothetical protein
MGNQQHGLAFFPELLNQTAQFPAKGFILTGGRFIENDEFRLGGQGRGKGHSFFLSLTHSERRPV